MKKRLVWAAFLFLGIGALVYAQDKLGVTGKNPVVDGTVAAGEYSWSMKLDGLTLYLNRTSDRLSAAVVADTSGWVAVGFGSDTMNGARIFIGAVENGRGTVSQQTGRGHSHSGAPKTVKIDSAVKEQGRTTVMELSLAAADVLSGDRAKLPMIVAYGNTDSITAYHAYRQGLVVDL